MERVGVRFVGVKTMNFPQLLTKSNLAKYLGMYRGKTLQSFLESRPDFPPQLECGRWSRPQVDKWLLEARNMMDIEGQAQEIMSEVDNIIKGDYHE